MTQFEEENLKIPQEVWSTSVEVDTNVAEAVRLPIVTAKNYNLVSSLAPEEIHKIADGYMHDPFFSKVLTELRKEFNLTSPKQPLFYENDNGLLYFEDWNGNKQFVHP